MGALLQNTIFGKSKNSFVSTWRTSNISTGSSAATQIKLPLVASGTYNFTVDWGDGTSNTITAWNQAQVSHTYLVAGDYVIKINGTCRGWQFNNTGDRLKILSIQSWGKLRLGSGISNFFHGCANLNLTSVSDVLDLTGTTNFGSAFGLCPSLTSIARINEWNTSNIINMTFMFNGCILFNQDLGGLNTSNVTNFTSMFQGAVAFNNGGSSSINSWNTSNAANMTNMFNGATAFNQNIGSWNVSNVTTFASMFTSARAFNQDIGAWNVSKVTTFQSMFNGAISFNNGGNSNINNWIINTTVNVNVNMNGMFQGTTVFNQTIDSWDMSRVTDISAMFSAASAFDQPLNSWDTSNITTMQQTFYNASNFDKNIGAWNVSKVISFQGMFGSATAFNNGGSNDINNWTLNTVNNITTGNMFASASNFNQPIGNWNTGNVTTMNSMFRVASLFNQNIGAWNVSNVTDFSYMFYGATSFNNAGSPDINNWSLKTTGTISFNQMFVSCHNFNQPVGNWNTVAVTNMSQMFQGAMQFNQNIGNWNVSNVSSFFSMFNNAFVFNNGGSPDINNWILKETGTVTLNNMFQGGGGSYPMRFNQPIGNWNTVAVTDMSGMFQKTGNGFHFFNQPIGNWNTSNVTNMSNMFCQGGTDGGAFDQNIGAWNVSKVLNFSSMFLGARQFNNGGSPDINNWTLSTTGAINMSRMFANINMHNLTTFNQPIGNWDTSAVTNMSQMFGATAGSVAFNQNIGNWIVSKVTDFSNFMINKSPQNFSKANLDAIYNEWSSRPIKPSINISFGTAKYTSASSAGRAILTASPNNWIITDGGI